MIFSLEPLNPLKPSSARSFSNVLVTQSLCQTFANVGKSIPSISNGIDSILKTKLLLEVLNFETSLEVNELCKKKCLYLFFIECKIPRLQGRCTNLFSFGSPTSSQIGFSLSSFCLGDLYLSFLLYILLSLIVMFN